MPIHSSTLPSPDHLPQRVRRYWVEDGLVEAMLGAGFLVLALVLALGQRCPSWLEGLLQAAAIVALVLGVRWSVTRLKWRVTYPRTGYVAYSRGSPARRVARLLGAFTGGAAVIFLSASLLARHHYRGYLFLLTVLLAALYLLLARWRAWTRGVAYAGVALFAGAVAVVLLSVPFWREVALQGGVHLALLGLAQWLGGLWTLRRYLRQHPRPLEDAP